MKAPTTAEEYKQYLQYMMSDFGRFCSLLQIVPKEGGKRIPFVLFPSQVYMCRNRTGRDIVLKARQVTITTIEVARDLWWFLTKPGARVLIVMQSQEDKKPMKDVCEKIRIFVDCLKKLGLKFNFGQETESAWSLPDTDSTLMVTQAGASLTSADRKGRGGTINRLHISEMASWGEFAENTFTGLMGSMTPTGQTEIVIESTPNGAVGYYYDLWKKAVAKKNNFKPHFLGWWLNKDYAVDLDPNESLDPLDDIEERLIRSGASLENIKWRRKVIRELGGGSDRKVNQEYPNDPETCFISDGANFFDVHLVQEQISKLPELLKKRTVPVRLEERNRLTIWHEPIASKKYIIGADIGHGVGKDFSVGIVLEKGTGRHMATLRDNKTKPWDFGVMLVRLAKLYYDATIASERDGPGLSAIDGMTKQENYHGLYKSTDGRPGWLTSMLTRSPMLDTLDTAHRRGLFSTLDNELLEEMLKFVIINNKPQAAPGAHDDFVMAAAIAFSVMTAPSRSRIDYDPYSDDATAIEINPTGYY